MTTHPSLAHSRASRPLPPPPALGDPCPPPLFLHLLPQRISRPELTLGASLVLLMASRSPGWVSSRPLRWLLVTLSVSPYLPGLGSYFTEKLKKSEDKLHTVTTLRPPACLPSQAYICVSSCCVRGPVCTHTHQRHVSLLPKEASTASFCNIRVVSLLHHPYQHIFTV